MQRRQHEPSEKLKIVLEGLRGQAMVAEICNRYQITQNQYCEWRDTLLKDGSKLFARGGADKEAERLRSENQRLKSIVGKLTIELKKTIANPSAPIVDLEPGVAGEDPQPQGRAPLLGLSPGLGVAEASRRPSRQPEADLPPDEVGKPAGAKEADAQGHPNLGNPEAADFRAQPVLGDRHDQDPIAGWKLGLPSCRSRLGIKEDRWQVARCSQRCP